MALMMQSIITAPIIRIIRIKFIYGAKCRKICAMARKRLQISNRLIMSTMLLCFCGLLLLSGLSLFFVQSPNDKATNLIAMAAHYETQLTRDDLSSDAIMFMRIEQQKLLTQAWKIAPFHEELQGLYEAQDVAKGLVPKRIATHISNQAQ